MVTDFCVICGELDKSKLENHHIKPRVLGGLDIPTNLLTVCGKCHNVFHEIGNNRHKMKELQRIGIEKAKILGKFKGRVPKVSRRYEEVLALHGTMTNDEIAKKLNIGVASIYRMLKKQRELNDHTITQK